MRLFLVCLGCGLFAWLVHVWSEIHGAPSVAAPLLSAVAAADDRTQPKIVREPAPRESIWKDFDDGKKSVRDGVLPKAAAQQRTPPPAARDPTYIFGAGHSSCGEYTTDRQDPSLKAKVAQTKVWVLGFLSGHNWASSSGEARPPDVDAAFAFVDRYCINNPLHSVMDAAAVLAQETGGRRVTWEWQR